MLGITLEPFTMVVLCTVDPCIVFPALCILYNHVHVYLAEFIRNPLIYTLSVFSKLKYQCTCIAFAFFSNEICAFGMKFTRVRCISYILLFPPLPLQASVPEWLILLNLTQYEQVLMDAGYDDIDFVSDITTEELQDIGITKKGTIIIIISYCV